MKSNTNTERQGKHTAQEFKEAVTIQVIKTPRGTMNHSYRNLSNVKPEKGYEHPKEIKDMSFAQKVHHILSEPDYEKWISWMPHGRAFKVHVPVSFENEICPKFFGHKRYSSFLRELNCYGFKHVSKGTDRNCYYHELMLKSRPHLCQYMPPFRDARRLVADPANEPNFYRISRQYPLDTSAQEQVNTLNGTAAKRPRNDSAMLPQGMALGAAALGRVQATPVMSPSAAAPSAFLSLISQNASPVTPFPPTMNPTAALLSLLAGQNKKKLELEQEQQAALIAAALSQVPTPAAPPSNADALTAVLGLLGQK